MKVNLRSTHWFRLGMVALLASFLLSTGLLAQEYKYADSWGEAGYALEAQSNSKVSVNYSIPEFAIADMQVNGKSMKNVELPGIFLPNDEGAPNLPGSGRYVAIPQGATAKVEIVSFRTETIKNIDLAPAPRIPWETETGPLDYAKNMEIYAKDAFYPAQPVKLSEVTEVRGIDVVMLGITPFQYNPVSKELIVYRDLKVEVTFAGGNNHFGEDRLRSRWWDPLLADMLLNFESLPKIDYNKSFQGKAKDVGCEYLIVTPTNPEFLQWADSIKQFRIKQGIQTDIMTVADCGGNNVNTLENFFNDCYNNWDVVPAAILLLGDYGTSATNSITSPIWNNYCASDNIFADVTNNDMPDMVFARMTAQNATHLETMVTKFLEHERTPPTSSAYYQNPITALGFQTERWFQICSEAVAGFWEVVQGKTANRINAIYSGTPGSTWSSNQNTNMVMNVFGPNGLGYIPASPNQVNCTWNGSAQDVVNGINNGAFMLQHRDHGFEQGWGEPAFQSSHINSLNNTDLTFVWSCNCLTGKYNMSGECFAEKFHRHTSGGQNSGALGINAASEVSYSFVNDTYVWGAYDNMWPDFLPSYGTTPDSRDVLPAFANSAGKYFLQQSNWPYNTNNKEVTYNLFHHHGDAFMTVYSEMPQSLTVTHNPILYAGVTSFDVTANDGALIALTVNGEIIATETATGGPVTIDIPGQVPPDQMLVTITKQNYYRYTALVDVIPPTGPYVVRESFEINDNTGGNGDGLMDYGESNMLSLTVENVGVQIASNVDVTLSTTDSFITITDGTESYGNIAAGATAVVPDGFAFDVANDIPDGHNAVFEVSATDGTDTWTSSFSIDAHAPVLEFVDFIIDDASGNNNGKIDPGETVDITIEIENSGSSEAYNIEGEIAVTDPYLTIVTANATYGDLTSGNASTATFSASAASNTPAGHMVEITFNLAADLGITGSDFFDVVIGQIPVLILDLDENQNSASFMETCLANVDVAFETLGSFPPDLNLYSTIFICLGVYPDNHVLSSSEGTTLANYLTNGGALYMEGGDTWYYDSQTAVHAMFNINGTSDGSGNMSSIQGQTGTFADGMSFSYSGDNNWMDHIDPISPAELILQNQSPVYGTGVSYDAGDYKTIGTSHEFGGLTDGTSPSTKEELMMAYLDFLGINATTTLQANIGSSDTEVCEGETIDFTDLSTGNPTSWNWTFEGGSPGSSAFQNPTVAYFTAGTYDVTLEISDGTDVSEITLGNYITVLAEPTTPGTPSGVTEVCANWGNTTYDISAVTGAETYDWILEPASAGSVTGMGISVTVEWEDGFLGDATLKVASENNCGTSNYSNTLEITRYLTEVSLEPFPVVCEYDPAFELTGGTPAGGTYSGTGVDNGWFDPTTAGVGTHTITYTYEDANGCENFAEESILVDPCVGIDEYGLSQVSIFPNPNTGSFKLELNVESSQPATLTIYNAFNEVVYTENKVQTNNFTREINLDDNATGVYYLHISSDEINLVRKIIIRK